MLTLDAKGRLTVPSRWRDTLVSEVQGQMVVSKNHAGCLALYPKPVWDAFEQDLLKLPLKHEAWRRLYIGSATEVEIDGSSRVLVPPELRSWAGLDREVVFMGVGDRFELWDKARYAAHELLAISAGMPEELQNKVNG